MNEIKRIHLGRQQFIISVEAYTELHDYLDDIKGQVGENSADVVEEVEMRMAELLTEHGVTKDRVVLASDVTYLKEQLGEPQDFKEETDHARPVAKEDSAGRRLFRDADHGMIAGVAAGLAAYLNIDAVIIRLLFLLLLFAGGGGVLLYVVLWLIVPEAKTTSDRLHMRGKAVTVGSLKEVVDRADVPGAPRRARGTFGRAVESIFKMALAGLGVLLSIASILGLLWLTTMSIYFMVHHVRLGSEVFFPIGASETAAFMAAMVSVGVILLFMLLIGISMVKRKWQLSGWAVAALIGVFFVASSVGGALGFDIAPKLQQRFQNLHHSRTQTLAVFASANLTGQDTHFIFVPDNKYFVEYDYFGNADISKVKTTVVNGVLEVDASAYIKSQICIGPCFDSGPDLQIFVHGSKLSTVSVAGTGTSFDSNQMLSQPTLMLNVADGSSAHVNSAYPAKAVLADNGSGQWNIQMDLQSPAYVNDGVSVDGGIVTIPRVGELDISSDHACDAGDPFIYLLSAPTTLLFNGKPVPVTPPASDSPQNYGLSNSYSCVEIDSPVAP